ncbi:MAG: Fur family transcriptional regulator [Ktedonobacterales bacterium]
MTQNMVGEVGIPTNEAVVISARILALFESMGLRNTRPRRLITERLAALACSGADFTAHDLWRAVQADDPHLGRATVYRAVDILVSQGFLDRVSFADGTHRFRMCGSRHHHHITCTRCQRVVEVDTCLPAEMLAAISARTDFALEGHSLELFGRCAACRSDGA